MDTIYLISFLVGGIFILTSFLLGGILHTDFHVEGEIPFLSPSVIATFVTMFGAMGLFFEKTFHLPPFEVTLLSIFIGIVSSTLLIFLVMIPLQKAQKSNAKGSKEMIGKDAEVLATVSQHSKGEIVYTQAGFRMSAPSITDGSPLLPGEKVRIVDVQKGVFKIEKKLKEEI
jgi:membrane protein implicated in regulation of membrane protease activity